MDKGKVLDSWKEIAAYLNRNIRTCQVWEHELGLPVHRLEGYPKSRVFAYTAELDAWREAKGQLPDGGEAWNGVERAGGKVAPAVITVRKSVRSWAIAALVAGPLLAAAATGLILWHRHPPPKPAIGRFTLKVEPGLWLDSSRRPWEMELPSQTAMTISSDGRFIIYCASRPDRGPDEIAGLYLRPLDRSEAVLIAGTECSRTICPFLSPDNKWVGFWADGWIRKVPVGGGVATATCDTERWLYGADWGPDNSIVFGDGQTRGLGRVSAEGGMPEALTTPDPERDEWSHRLPHWLPDGKGVLFTLMRHGLDRQPALGLLRLDTRKYRILLEDAADARYIRTGHLVFMRQGVLMAVGFDARRQEVVGQPFVLVDNVLQSLSGASWYNTVAGQFAVSGDGSLVYAKGMPPPKDQNWLVWVDQQGNEEPVTDLRFPYYGPRLSPDGKRIAYMAEGRIWVYDLPTGTNSPLTTGGMAGFPVWSPDGRRILFAWYKSLAENLYWQPHDRSAPMERLTTSELSQTPGSFSPDGQKIAFVEVRPDTGGDTLILDLRSGGVTTFLNEPTDWEVQPEFSPDGRWIAYQSHASSTLPSSTDGDQIWVRPFPGPGAKHMVSTEGGAMPCWSRDGRHLFWLWADAAWVADVRMEGEFSAGKPRRLFQRPLMDWGSSARTYDLSPDGKRFLMVKLEPKKPTPVTEMVFVQSWFEEIKRLTQTSKK